MPPNIFISFLKYSLAQTPYDAFCKANGLHAFDDLPSMLFSQFRGNRCSDFSKWIEHNIFVPDPLKTYLETVYVRASRLFTVLRYSVGRGVRRRRPVQTELDLSLQPFGHPSTWFELFDSGKRYRFKFSDILNIITSSLTHSMEFISDPVPIRNPYTGLMFSDANLYAIYLQVRDSKYAVPSLFVQFMGMDFDLHKFGIKYECILRDLIIEANIENMSPKKRRLEIRNMLTSVRVYHPLKNRSEPIFRRLDEIPCSELDQFKKWLLLYFIHLYSLNTYYAHISMDTLLKEMLAFRNNHPKFGV